MKRRRKLSKSALTLVLVAALVLPSLSVLCANEASTDESITLEDFEKGKTYNYCYGSAEDLAKLEGRISDDGKQFILTGVANPENVEGGVDLNLYSYYITSDNKVVELTLDSSNVPDFNSETAQNYTNPFRNVKNLTMYGVQLSGKGMFYNCPNLVSVKAYDSLLFGESDGDFKYFFANCPKLTSVSMEALGNGFNGNWGKVDLTRMFYGDKALRELYLNRDVMDESTVTEMFGVDTESSPESVTIYSSNELTNLKTLLTGMSNVSFDNGVYTVVFNGSKKGTREDKVSHVVYSKDLASVDMSWTSSYEVPVSAFKHAEGYTITTADFSKDYTGGDTVDLSGTGHKVFSATPVEGDNHTFGDNAVIKNVNATCTEYGYTLKKCSKCLGEIKTNIGTELAPHEYSKLVVDVEPTCEDWGSKSYHCQACDKQDKTTIERIAPKGHNVPTPNYASSSNTVTVKCADCEEGTTYNAEKCNFVNESGVNAGDIKFSFISQFKKDGTYNRESDVAYYILEDKYGKTDPTFSSPEAMEELLAINKQMKYTLTLNELSSIRNNRLFKNADNIGVSAKDGSLPKGYELALTFDGKCISDSLNNLSYDEYVDYIKYFGKTVEVENTGEYKIVKKPINYRIKYNTNGGDVAGLKKTYTIEDEDFDLTSQAPSREGAEFLGWYSDPECTKEVNVIKKGSTGDLEVYAKWQAKEYTIEYMQDGNLIKESLLQDADYTDDSVITFEQDPTKLESWVEPLGATFKGWSIQGVEDEECISSLTFAQLKEIADKSGKYLYLIASYDYTNFNITYDLDGGTIPDNAEYTKSYTVITDDIVLPTPEKEDYEFEGWYLVKEIEDGVVEELVDETAIPLMVSDITLKAHYTENKVTVDYYDVIEVEDSEGNKTVRSLNNGFVDDPYENSLYIKEYSKSTPSEYLVLKTPIKGGYIFDHWAIGTLNIEDKTFTESETITSIPAYNGESVTVYAVWKDGPKASISSEDSVTVEASEEVLDYLNGVAGNEETDDATYKAVLEVKEVVSDATEFTGSKALDINITRIKVSKDGSTVLDNEPITELDEADAITFTVAIPDYAGEGNDLYLIKDHYGVKTLVEDFTYTEASKTLQFTANEFSTYTAAWGTLEVNKDINGDGIPEVNLDGDDDGIPDTNIDIDGDGIPDVNVDNSSGSGEITNIDWDKNGTPDINIDIDNDGSGDVNKINKPGKSYDSDGNVIDTTLNKDVTGDGFPNINIDLDNDGFADLNIDTNGDGVADVNIDTDGDGIADKNIDANRNGVIDSEEGGNGSGNGSGNGNGNGSGSGSGNGSGNGNGSGSGNGSSSGNDNGNGSDSGDGSDNGSGSGSGDGDGNGSDSNSGNGTDVLNLDSLKDGTGDKNDPTVLNLDGVDAKLSDADGNGILGTGDTNLPIYLALLACLFSVGFFCTFIKVQDESNE